MNEQLTRRELIRMYRTYTDNSYEDIFEFARDYYGLLGVETCKLLNDTWFSRLFSYVTTNNGNVVSGVFNIGNITQTTTRN